MTTASTGDSTGPFADPTDQFTAAINAKDLDLLADCLHPDFEMIVPQQPARGFRGRDQELANIRALVEAYPDFHITVLRKARAGAEVWTESSGLGTGIEMSAVVIWQLDEATNTLKAGRYFSDVVQHDAPSIDAFMDRVTTAGERA